MKFILILFISIFSFSFFAQTPLKEIKLGTQTWVVTNLNTSKFANGEIIPQAKTAAEWKKAGEERKPVWAFYNYIAENGKKYGKIYNWYAVNDKRGLAPKGYKIPSEADWKVLIDYCGGIMDAGKKLKSKSGWKNNGNASAPNGFNGLPGGFCLDNGTFGGIETAGGWWTSSEGQYENTAWDRYLEAEKNTSETYSESKTWGFSVRFMKIK